MHPTITLLRIIGSPYASGNTLPRDNVEASDLHALAAKNKIKFLYLEALREQSNLGPLAEEYEKECIKYTETMLTAVGISQLLTSVNINHVVFKTLRPYPTVQHDVDVLLLGSNDDYLKAIQTALDARYTTVGIAPNQTMVRDPRCGDEMDREVTIYGIDIYKEAAASHIIYMDKAKLSKCTRKLVVMDHEFRVLTPEAELAVILMHSVIPEQMYTLAEYYTTLYYLAAMDDREVSDFINIVKENNITLAVKSSLAITAVLHKEAHGAVPQKLTNILATLNARTSEVAKLRKNGFEVPHKYSILTVMRVLAEKFQEDKFRRSVLAQMLHMFEPRLAKWVIAQIILRRRRERY